MHALTGKMMDLSGILTDYTRHVQYVDRGKLRSSAMNFSKLFTH
jgi:hypothetical protein